MILAAGHGTRLGDLGRRVAKVLVPIDGRPLLARHLETMEAAGVQRVVVNAHHLASQIEAFIRSYDGQLELVCVVEPTPLGTAGAVRNALEHLGRGPFIVVYGDVVIEDSLLPLLDVHRRLRPIATLGVHEAPSAKGKGVVDTDSDGYVTSFVEKGDRDDGPVLVNSGIYVVETRLVAELPLGRPLDFGHDVLPRALEDGRRIAAHRFVRPVIDIGTPEGLAQAQGRA
jgi:mannose-1-phosphate guanylyltransferase